jgi:hypothetical protein
MSSGQAEAQGINIYREGGLHAALKEAYALPGDRIEAPVGGYVADILRGDLCIEIQTGSFGALRAKLTALLAAQPVLVVYPVVAIKWIAVYDAAGEQLLRRRKSPRRGHTVELFSELVYLGELVAHPRLSFEVALVEVEELRRNDGQGSWRRQGVSISERRLLHVLSTQRFDDLASLAALLPAELGDPFTNRELAQRLGVGARLASKITYCLRQAGCLHLVGRAGRASLFSKHPAAIARAVKRSTQVRIMTLHPQGKQGVNIDQGKYELVREAILKALHSADELGFGELMMQVERAVGGALDGSVSWYVTTVKLDLEARGLIERLTGPGPQRLRLQQSRGPES